MSETILACSIVGRALQGPVEPYRRFCHCGQCVDAGAFCPCVPTHEMRRVWRALSGRFVQYGRPIHRCLGAGRC